MKFLAVIQYYKIKLIQILTSEPVKRALKSMRVNIINMYTLKF